MGSKYSFSFIHCDLSDTVKKDLELFWAKHDRIYNESLETSIQANINSPNIKFSINSTTIEKEPAALARNINGSVVAVVFLYLRSLDPELGFGENAYFQHMYVPEENRTFRLTSGLYQYFLAEFIARASTYKKSVEYLMAENANPGLQTKGMRRYFAKSGFRYIGRNSLNSEVWALKI